MSTNKTTLIICSLILSLGMLSGGYNIGKGIYLFKKLSHTVTVKGLAEKSILADLGIWEINYREIGNDLAQINVKLTQDQATVVEFLKSHGFTDAEIGKSKLKVEDRLANVYNQTPAQNANEQRYVVTSGIRVRSNKVDLIQKAVQMSSSLLQLGVPLAFDFSSLDPNPSYYLTNLDAIRPSMMSEATQSARILAEQFAKDSHSQLGSIQRANQGVFQIMGRDTSTMSTDWSSNENALGSIEKKVRLVTTMDYQLKS